jgi:hypothetical protein
MMKADKKIRENQISSVCICGKYAFGFDRAASIAARFLICNRVK